MLANLILGALFFVLVPGILVTLPRGGSKYTVAFVHAIVFVLVLVALQYFYAGSTEGFQSAWQRNMMNNSLSQLSAATSRNTNALNSFLRR